MRKRTAAVLALALAGATAAVTVATEAQAAGGFDFTRSEVVATGLEVPWGVAFLPDGSALVAERMRARIVRVRAGAAPVQVATVPNVSTTDDGGLLGLALSPTYAQDNLVYAFFTAATDNRIVRFTLANAQNQQVVVSGIPRGNIHSGGRIAFGPDGMLYAGVGEAGRTGNAQNLNSLGGKILRMRPDGTVPPGNPFGNSLVFSYGHRNVQGLAWDAQGRLWATEFGQNAWDEINLIVAGGNYGWPTVEGRAGDARFRDPLVVWTPAEASPSGAAIVNNTLFVGALRGTRLWLVPLTGDGGVGVPTIELQGTFGRLRTVVVGPDGYLWLTTSNRDSLGSPRPGDDRVIRVPPTTVTPSQRYEAETAPAVCQGTIDSNQAGFSGSGFCNGNAAVGAYAHFTVNARTAGTATLGVRFANGHSSATARPANLVVNGSTAATVSFEPTGAWTAWTTKTLTVPLNAGSNTIRLDPTTAAGLPNIDYLNLG